MGDINLETRQAATRCVANVRKSTKRVNSYAVIATTKASPHPAMRSHGHFDTLSAKRLPKRSTKYSVKDLCNMNKNIKTITEKNTASLFLACIFSLTFTTGCSQNKTYHKTIHPGKFELIHLGPAEGIPDPKNPSKPFQSYQVQEKVIYSSSSVMHPTYFSLHLLEHTEIRKGESVLDIGTGTGVQAIFAADNASHVLAMDISKQAIEDTALNARRLGLSEKITVRESDLFNALSANEKFDVITSTIPHAWNAATQGNWKLQERFFTDVGKHLKADGRIYFLTGKLDNMARTKALAEKNGLKVVRVDMAYFRVQHVEPIVYVFKHEDAAMWTQEDLIKAKQNE